MIEIQHALQQLGADSFSLNHDHLQICMYGPHLYICMCSPHLLLSYHRHVGLEATTTFGSTITPVYMVQLGPGGIHLRLHHHPSLHGAVRPRRYSPFALLMVVAPGSTSKAGRVIKKWFWDPCTIAICTIQPQDIILLSSLVTSRSIHTKRVQLEDVPNSSLPLKSLLILFFELLHRPRRLGPRPRPQQCP